ncbi:MAG: hypothetical protein R3C45_04205 [Phycisphaerales bacterium]
MARITAEQIEACGVVGAGGAGFPTHVKLKAKAEFILLNAAECEPLLHKDKELRRFGREVLDGLEAARRAGRGRRPSSGSGQVRGRDRSVAPPTLNGQTTITPLSASYPSGDEFILVYDCTGRIIPPGQIPLSVGCVVINVETALNIVPSR